MVPARHGVLASAQLAPGARIAHSAAMDFEDLLLRYFATAEIGAIAPGALETGLDRLRVDFGLEQDRGRRFGLSALLYMLGAAPAPDDAFEAAADREAARSFMDMADGFDG